MFISLNTWRTVAIAASAVFVSCSSQAPSTGTGGQTGPCGACTGTDTNTPQTSSGTTAATSSGTGTATSGSNTSGSWTAPTSSGATGSTTGAAAGSGTNAASGGGAASGAGSSGVAGTVDAGTAQGSMTTSPDDPNTVTITMGTFTVPPNQEVFMCQDFPNPFGGQDAAIGTSQADMAAGSHHLHVFYGEDSPPVPNVAVCTNPYEFRSLLFASGQPHLVAAYPAGMAAKLQGSLGVRLQSHYLNTSASMITANVVVKFTKVDPSTITKWVAQLYFNRVVLSVPPGNGQQVSTTCTIPSTYGEIGLISGASHMHMRGVHFVATASTGTKLIETTQWDEPPIQAYDPPIMLKPGDSINWTCTYNNNTGNTLTFGDSALQNEMCIFLARFYSAPSGNDIECQSPTTADQGIVSGNVP